MDAIDKIVFNEQTPDLKGGPRFLIRAHTCQDLLLHCQKFHCDFVRIDPKFVNNPELSDIQVKLTKLCVFNFLSGYYLNSIELR